MQNHLRNEDIQRFLDHDTSENEKKQILNHIYTCSRCRCDLEEYKSIFQILETEENFELPIEFTQNIVSQLTPYVPYHKKEKWSDFSFASIGILFSLMVALYYLGSERIQSYLGMSQQLLQKVKIIPLNIDLSYFNILVNPYLIAFIGILAMILFLDRVVLQKKMFHLI
jgi:hypothetical protein